MSLRIKNPLLAWQIPDNNIAHSSGDKFLMYVKILLLCCILNGSKITIPGELLQLVFETPNACYYQVQPGDYVPHETKTNEL